MSDDVVLIDRREGVAIITLNRPEALNALSAALRARLHEILAEVGRDDGIGAIVLTGAGERAFCAGLDLKEIGASQGAVVESVGDDARSNPVEAMRLAGKPIIGAINGVTVTGGLEIALACDILIASTAARFADTHVKVGLMPGWGLSQRLPRLIGVSRAKEMSLTGAFVDARTAEAWGLVNRVVGPDALLPTAIMLAQAIAANPPASVRSYRDLIDRGLASPLADALAMEREFSIKFNSEVAASAIRDRRQAVMESNRQTK